MQTRNARRGLREAKAASLELEPDSQPRPSSPLEKEASVSEPSIPKSPCAVLEAIATSECAEKEILKDQSDVQVSIIEALKLIVEEISKARHQAALFRAELQKVQWPLKTLGNHEISKRRHCRKCGRTNHNARTCRAASKVPAKARRR